MTLFSLFLDSVSVHHDRIAVSDGSRRVSYGALEARSRAIACALVRAGVRPGDRVGLRLDRGADLCSALLGVMRAGAAYVPCDVSFPLARVRAVWAEASVACVIETDRSDDSRPSHTPESLMRAGSGCDLPPGVGPAPDDAAYLIYTSGSTGAPKGVVLSHRAVATFVEGESAYFDIMPADRVANGFSPAFDAAVEEWWLAWRHGAAVVCIPPEVARSPELMPRFLRERSVSVWSTVPTFLAGIDSVPEGVRLLIVGGESCPEDLVRRFARAGRRMVNTYGPTETAVVATAAELVAGRPVTIGYPLRGYQVAVVDARRNPLPAGSPGELAIGGPGLADGYRNNPELTDSKFIRPDWAPGMRYYLTGDLVFVDDAGALRFLGRADDQVKLRGHRIEPGEIENRLLALPGVTGAVVAVMRESDGGDWLAAYVTCSASTPPEEREMRTLLRESLPAYMVPARIIRLESLPVQVSGKIDRSKLPKPSPPVDAPDGEAYTACERMVREAWMARLPGAVVTRETDFFEAGGHSLAAAAVVSKLRAGGWDVSIADLYARPRFADFAGGLTRVAPVPVSPERHRESGGDAEKHFLCGLAQALSLYPLFLLAAPPWIFAWTIYHLLVLHDHEHQVTWLVVAAAAAILGFGPVRMALAIAVKWLLLGRVKPGRYRLWGFWYWRFWFTLRVLGLAESRAMRGTPWLNTYLRLLGARVHDSAHLETLLVGVPDMLSVGAGASVGHDASLLGYVVEGDFVIVGSIGVGKSATLGAKCLLSPDTAVGDGAEVPDGTMLVPGQKVPAGERWEGSPARRVGRAAPCDGGSPKITTGLKAAFALSHGCLALFPVLAAAPGAWMLGYVDSGYCDFYEGYADLWKLALVAIPAAASYVLVLALLVVAAKWILLGRVKPGRYALNSWRRLRHWFVESLMHLSLETLFPFFATVYTPAWLRLLGAKVGAWTEVSTAENMNPDLLRLGEGVFVADAVCLGASRIRDGYVYLDTVEVGAGTFLGNNGVTSGGVRLGADGLVGVLSKAPDSESARATGKSWLGLPAFELPRRQPSAEFGEALTRRPPLRLFLSRAFVEFWRIVLPGSLTGFCAFALFLVADDMIDREQVGYAGLVALFPVLLLFLALGLTGFVVLLKWVVVGRQRPAEHPLWSFGVWRAEFVAAMHEHIAVPSLIGLLMGTPFAPWYYRLLGAGFGRRVYCETPYLTEFDLVRVGDGASLNHACDLQTHLFEDRVMKMSRVRVGARASVGALSVVLYDGEVAPGARLAGLSLVMKGETVPAGGLWAGVPARRLDSRS